MEAMLVSIIAISQIFAVIGVGWLCAGKCAPFIGNPDEKFWGTLAAFVYVVCMPALIVHLFNDFVWDVTQVSFIYVVVISVVVSIAVTVLTMRYTKMEGKERSTIAAIAFHPNCVFLGFPLIIAVFGENALPYAVLFAIVEFPITTIAGIYILRRAHGGKGISAQRIVFQKMIKDPVIWSFFVGMGLSLTSLKIPAAMIEPVHMLGMIASPLALLVIGARIYHSKAVVKSSQSLAVLNMLKLAILPVIAWGVVELIGLQGIPAAVIILLIGTPVAISTIVMVEQHGGATDLAAQSITSSTLLSAFTLTLTASLLLT